jgi:hypothetical protein
VHFSDLDPMDVPPPQTVDEVVRVFPVPVMSFVPQASLEEMGVGTVGYSSDGGPMILDAVSISYTLWRNPLDHDDPDNLAELDDTLRETLDAPPVRPLPDWMMVQRELFRYPSLWEAVTTTRRSPGSESVESTLVMHVNHILVNTFRDQRVTGGFPGELDDPVTKRHIQPAVVRIDGTDVPGVRIDTDPNVYAVGASLGDRLLTAVVARDHLPFVTLEFATRS